MDLICTYFHFKICTLFNQPLVIENILEVLGANAVEKYNGAERLQQVWAVQGLNEIIHLAK